MATVSNDYNQHENAPRVLVGNYWEERALAELTGKARGSSSPNSNDTATRITGPILSATDYRTVTQIDFEEPLHVAAGSKLVAAHPPLRETVRDKQRLALAEQIIAAQQAEEEARIAAEMNEASWGGRPPLNKKKAIDKGRTIEESKQQHPLNQQAISFHTHHLRELHGVTATNRGGVHTFSKSTRFSKPISELLEEDTTR